MKAKRKTLEEIVNHKLASPAILRMTMGKLARRKKRYETEKASTLDDYFKHIPSDGSGLM